MLFLQAVKSKPRRHLGNPEAASSALVLRQPRSVEVYEEPVSSPLYMDFSGHCHAKLNDGDYLFMDQFGHAHAKLDDGGFLYMDRNGSCHNSLDDQVPVHEEHRARASHPHRRHRPALSPVMLGDLSVPPPARIERMAHDAELRKMQSKAVATSRLQQKVEGSKPSTATRRAHHIAQPRRHN